MKTTRVYATACLFVSSVALIAAANLSFGDEPGVTRLSGYRPQVEGGDPGVFPAPVPDASGYAGTPPMGDPAMAGPGVVYEGAAPPEMGDPMMGNPYPQPGNYAPYFDRSFGATEMVPEAMQGRQPFGPMLMFEQNIDDGLGYNKGSSRLNARIPYHIFPNTTVFLADLSAAVTSNGNPYYNYGLVYRNYDAALNRVFGVNAFGDYDEGYGNTEWNRVTVGLESLGKYIDWRANGYLIVGNDSLLLSSALTGDPRFSGSNVVKNRQRVYDNAYSGFDVETGGPLPLLGRYGMNMYAGAYVLGNSNGYDTVGFQARWQALVTESLSVNTYLTTDDTFGTNSWVSLAYTIPNYRDRRFMKPTDVRERLQDPVMRSNRIQTNIDTKNHDEALLNKNGLAYTVMHVDPNATTAGVGTFEDPYRTFQQAANNNNALIDTIYVNPRDDDSGTNLTAVGGITLFDCQTLMSSTRDLTFTSFDGTVYTIPGTPTNSNLGPLISDPNMLAGGSVVRLANQNTVLGMRIDASNAANTVFGNAIRNTAAITDVTLIGNTLTDFTVGANLQNVQGRTILTGNTFDGLLGASVDGLNLTAKSGSTMSLLLNQNTANDNSGTGLSVIAKAGSTINADKPGNVVSTGVLDNIANGNGRGIVMESQAGAIIRAVVDGNTANDNTADGFTGEADGGLFRLASMSSNRFNGNSQNGAFIHYLNGGTFQATSEDADGDGNLDAGEDLNGNGRLDQGIVKNAANNNTIAGMCIFGENASVGTFDIGGPTAALGNTFRANIGGGVLTDLRDTATAQIDALFNTVQGAPATPGLTIVLDFIDPGQASQVDINGRQVNTFNVGAYGFNNSQFDTVTNSILSTVKSYYRNLPTSADNALSTIPEGQELNLDFVIGDTGVAPSNGATEYYVLTIGDSAANLGGLAGQAGDIGNIRNATGNGPGQGLAGTTQVNGGSAVGVYTNSINQFSTLLNPQNAFNGPRVDDAIYVEAPSNTPQYAVNALTSGNLTFTRRAIGLVTAHELGHALSLRHINNTGATTPTGQNAIMATPAIDAPLQVLVQPAEFALSGTNPGELAGEAAFQQRDIAQLAAAVGTRVASGETGVGFQVTATDNARLLASSFNNNTITGAKNDGIAIVMSGQNPGDTPTAEGVTIQGNTITGGDGNGIRLQAEGPGAVIVADSTIGGAGTNQGNTISGNAGDGFRALVRNEGQIFGNLINNRITGNDGNGAAFTIENGGVLDFGTTANNRKIQKNVITGNGGAGLLLNQTVSATTVAELDITAIGNTISDNVAGGIVSNMNGPNNAPPLPPLVLNNNVLNLKAGGTNTADFNTLSGNGDVGIGVNVNGNGFANVEIQNAAITGTTNGADPVLDGDGINLRRAGAGLLVAKIEDVTATGNAGDGLDVDVQGNDKNDPNQPNSGTINSVEWNRNNFSNNTLNGARFRTRGEAMLMANGKTNTLNANGQNGILIQTTQNSSIGDPTVGPAPGQRSVLDGNTADGNGIDGIQISATENSRALLSITSNAIAPATGAHAALSAQGNTSISDNGRDGIRITTSGADIGVAEQSDILITSGTAQTTIDGNGTTAGGNGIRWDASGRSQASVRVTNTIIRNSIAGVTESTTNNGNGVLDIASGEDLNGNGVLDSGEDGNGVLDVGEDQNGNGVLDAGEDRNSNGDIDVVDGDGIQANFTGNSNAVLIVGGVGQGNTIQSNADDGIAITATGNTPENTTWSITPGAAVTPVDLTTFGFFGPVQKPTPTISIVDNIIGGENNGVAAGNGGDGISINTLGGTDIGTLPANVDSTISTTDASDLFVSHNFGAIETGAIPKITISDNVITRNTRRGANVLLTGAGGTRNRELGAQVFDPIEISFTDNTISANGMEGIFYRADSDMSQNRFVYLPNFPIVGPPADDNQNYSPFRAEFMALNNGSVNGNTSYMAPYLNLRTVQNSLLTVTGNTIQNNGAAGSTGEGLLIKVGTGAYVAADVRGNTFGGNLEEDFRTASFVSADETFISVDNTGDGTFDFMYLDDTAQLDLRFQNNTGNQIDAFSGGDSEIAAEAGGALYTQLDVLKDTGFFPGINVDVLRRQTDLFQVENGPNLNDPNNFFRSAGITQNINDNFSFRNGNVNYNVRAAADPLFPNIGFAPFLP